MFQQPIDCDPKVQALMNAFPVGKRFSRNEAAAVLGMNVYKVTKFILALQNALKGCPEGEQIRIVSFGGGGHKFIQPKST